LREKISSIKTDRDKSLSSEEWVPLSNSVGCDGKIREPLKRNRLKESYVEIESYERNLLLGIIKNE
jgi:hypothetical protein